MINTKYLIAYVDEVPSYWAFNHYLDLGEVLNGQNIMIKSIFNPKDSRPSMSIYVTVKNKYKYNDHSTGNRGDMIDLVMYLFKIDYPSAISKIIWDYNKYLLENDGLGGKEDTLKRKAGYKVKEVLKRKWSIDDKKYWTQYYLGSKLLEHFGIYPLENYTLSNGTNSFIIEGRLIYGFFSNQGEMYKLYQPMVKTRRFMSTGNYLQGKDQLEYKEDTLVITKALKDVAVLKVLDLGIESVAPSSENGFLTKEELKLFQEKYKRIVVIFDNDDPGIKAMENYHKKYGFEYIISPLEKDPSDSVKKHGIELVRETFKKLIYNE